MATETTENPGGVQPATKKDKWEHVKKYIGTCKEKFQKLGTDFNKGFGAGWGPGFGPASLGGPGHRHCTHVCQECKKTEEAATAPATGSAQS
ncbi:hypothetical protein QTP70_022552 [Hemibagrus guttatus]|uniref:Uncharacterized protein n=1 Tax=Hemibagrus guttatus TaxID=175788 RepID=A0AAE0QAE4_9TELE|nr:hypothetical protein QTP70_022552 [Hemibagrus guttatus]